MPVWPELFRNFDLVHKDAWKVQASGFHVGSYDCPILGQEAVDWLEGDLSGAVKRVSRAFPVKGGITVSVEWKFLFQLDDTDGGDWIRLHLFGNEEAIDNAAATYNGYAVEVVGNGGLNLLTADGGGAWTNIHGPGWTADTEQHQIKVTCEYDSGNMQWRTYLDDMDNPIDGPDADNTYTAANYMGFAFSANNRQRATGLVMTW